MTARQSLADLDAIISQIRAQYPRASLIHAQLVIYLMSRPSAIVADIGEDLCDDRDSSAAWLAVHRLETMGLVEVDRSGPIQMGHQVRLVRR